VAEDVLSWRVYCELAAVPEWSIVNVIPVVVTLDCQMIQY